MSSALPQAYKEYVALKREQTDLNNAIAVLSWDQEVFMPSGGGRFRAQQLATLSAYAQRLAQSPQLEEVLHLLKDDEHLTREEARNVHLSLRDFNKASKLDEDFARRWSAAVSSAYHQWHKAKSEKSFRTFLPKLESIVELCLEKAERYGYKDSPYEALMDDYEPDLTIAEVDRIFGPLQQFLVPFIHQVETSGIRLAAIEGRFPADAQLALCKEILFEMGYPTENGRLDLSPHPFSTNFSPEDSRITTRISENDFLECLGGTTHEMGHAFYELGLEAEHYGLPRCEASSLGVHESQSRFWENHIGQSYSFCETYLPLLKKHLNLGNLTPRQLYQGMNRVSKDYIRINADELTYHLHIILRYEIEKMLINGHMPASEAENAWNELFKQYFGMDVPDASKGVLQDIHWSHGSFGYFPTYTLGSLLSAQLADAVEEKVGTLDGFIRQKNFAPVLGWLREHVHRHGRHRNLADICTAATGTGLDSAHFIRYAQEKYVPLYQV